MKASPFQLVLCLLFLIPPKLIAALAKSKATIFIPRCTAPDWRWFHARSCSCPVMFIIPLQNNSRWSHNSLALVTQGTTGFLGVNLGSSATQPCFFMSWHVVHKRLPFCAICTYVLEPNIRAIWKLQIMICLLFIQSFSSPSELRSPRQSIWARIGSLISIPDTYYVPRGIAKGPRLACPERCGLLQYPVGRGVGVSPRCRYY